MADQLLNENLTDSAAGDASTAGKIPATPEGIIVAYGSIVFMALLPIYFGAKRSVEAQRKQKVSLKLRTCTRSTYVPFRFIKQTHLVLAAIRIGIRERDNI